jgi:hypothetical protein
MGDLIDGSDGDDDLLPNLDAVCGVEAMIGVESPLQ